MENTNAGFNKWAIPVRWGIIIAIVSILLFTLANMVLVGKMVLYFIAIFFSFAIPVVLMGVTAAQQKKAMGGYITFQDAFQAIFITILILVVVNTIYSYIYLHFIDPDFSVRMKNASLAWAESMHAPQEKLDEMAKNFDEQAAEKNKVKTQLMGFFWSIVLYSIFGFICAAIVKKKRPLTD